MLILFYYFLVINILAFAITGYDKYLAKERKKRIPEKILFSLASFGGTIGVGAAMLFFRHKTAKPSFLWTYFGITAFQIVLVYFLFYKRLLNVL